MTTRRAGIGITWLGHGSATIDVVSEGSAPVRLLTDPVLGARVGPLARHTTRPHSEHWEGADAVLFSHLHHDHADVPSLKLFPPVPVAASRTNRTWLARHGFASAALPEPDSDQPWWEVAPGVEVREVRADHVSRPMPHRPNAAALGAGEGLRLDASAGGSPPV